MVQKWKHGFEKDSWYRLNSGYRLMVQTWTHGKDMGHMGQTWTHCIDMDSWYWQRLMLCTQTYGIDNTHGIDLSSWYNSIGTPESHTYERAECCPSAGLFGTKTVFFDRKSVICS